MQKGIWKYEKLLPNIMDTYKLSLGEGGTPLESYQIKDRNVLLKREDLNPNKSFKDRSLAFWISSLFSQGKKEYVISSSGNAASSAISYVKLIDAELTIFVSENIPGYKYDRLESQVLNSSNIHLERVPKPKSDAIKFASQSNIINLRGSVDDQAIEGFKTISYEIEEQTMEVDAVFVCCSSGTSTLGIVEGYRMLGNRTIPAVHIVQTSKVNPIASYFDKNFERSNTSLVNAVSDKVAKRKRQVIEVVEETHGSGWVVSDIEIKSAKIELESMGINVEGFNAYVGYAGYKKAIENGYEFRNPVVLISGI